MTNAGIPPTTINSRIVALRFRRFLIHVLPDGFHRIRHYGLFAGAARKVNIAKIRALLGEMAEISNSGEGALPERDDHAARDGD